MISAAALQRVPCTIVLPADFESKTRASHHLIDPKEDRRRYPRQRCPTDAIVRYESTFPTLRRPSEFYRVMVRDVSRGGIGFLHGEEMFPHEKALFVFPNGTRRTLKVQRCRRLGPQCFHIGAVFDEPLDDLSEGQWR